MNYISVFIASCQLSDSKSDIISRYLVDSSWSTSATSLIEKTKFLYLMANLTGYINTRYFQVYQQLYADIQQTLLNASFDHGINVLYFLYHSRMIMLPLVLLEGNFFLIKVPHRATTCSHLGSIQNLYLDKISGNIPIHKHMESYLPSMLSQLW